MFRLRCYYYQKFGNSPKEYEDAFASRRLNNSKEIAISISDGATESSFSNDWAKMLVRNYIKYPYLQYADLKRNIDVISKRWWLVLEKHKLPWYAEEKVKMGSFATLLGSVFILDDSGTGTSKGIAVGDSCIFHISNDSLVFSFPIQKSDYFGSSPTLISSNLRNNTNIEEHIKTYNRKFFSGDIFVFMTDALACWFLQEHESMKKPWKEIEEIFCTGDVDNSVFYAWINDLREQNRLRNDDYTLLILNT